MLIKVCVIYTLDKLTQSCLIAAFQNHKDFVQMMLNAENDAEKEGFEEETEMLDQSVPKKKG